MKADFAEHNCTFILYPYRCDVWRKKAIPIQELIIHLFLEIIKYEKVYLGTQIEEIDLQPYMNYVIPMKYNDIWIRDTGIIPLSKKGEGVYFLFNSWGGSDGLYSDWSKDLQVPAQMNDCLKLKIKKSQLTLEGGNLTTDGNGTLITIKSSIFNKNRNPNFTLEQIERVLLKDLDIKKIIWIEEGLKYDETGGHIDNLCIFADENTVFLAWTDDPNNEQYVVVHKAYDVLIKATNTKGHSFRIIKIPLPSIFLTSEEDCRDIEINEFSKKRVIGERIQASYINFIFVNGAVIVPQFDNELDSQVLNIFKEFFKEKKVIPFPAREIVLGGGGLHCITKNI